MFTALAASNASTASEMAACIIVRIFAQRERAGVSAADNAVLVSKARNKQSTKLGDQFGLVFARGSSGETGKLPPYAPGPSRAHVDCRRRAASTKAQAREHLLPTVRLRTGAESLDLFRAGE